ncbi:hypothetical protein HIM_05620 [Hirsutella minnesotensis 3608]|uniref:BHLH domain-containing protein n=1 Tax=Hirsutella minnesotensis 3608 TaxID=1043627 RepID=A0A0F8A5D4_9HYPO|nr:hypothetical protein HIM_05620 [Hirsutella minnesotensis 3608]
MAQHVLNVSRTVPNGNNINLNEFTEANSYSTSLHNDKNVGNHGIGFNLKSMLRNGTNDISIVSAVFGNDDSTIPSGCYSTIFNQEKYSFDVNTEFSEGVAFPSQINEYFDVPYGDQIQNPAGFSAQPTGNSAAYEKSLSGHWINASIGSIPASHPSGFPSPIQKGKAPAMPSENPHLESAQEIKCKRRRESHNVVERRRRDKVNERIQCLSKLVPPLRLDNERIRKLIQNGTLSYPILSVNSSPSQVTPGRVDTDIRGKTVSSLSSTGDNNRGPTKSDILSCAVSWTRDLMWLLHTKLQQQEELMNMIVELGGHTPFELTEHERRIQTELIEAMANGEAGFFSSS